MLTMGCGGRLLNSCDLHGDNVATNPVSSTRGLTARLEVGALAGHLGVPGYALLAAQCVGEEAAGHGDGEDVTEEDTDHRGPRHLR